MEQIILEVDDVIAQKWREASHTTRKKVTAFIQQILQKETKDLPKGAGRPSPQQINEFWESNQKELPAYLERLNKMGKEAASNGLSTKKLAELMEWDEETVKNLFGETNNNV